MEQARKKTATKKMRALEIRRAMDAIYLEQLKTIMLVMAGYYLFTAVAHVFFLAPTIRGTLVILAGITGLTSAGMYLLLRFEKIAARYSHIAFLPAALAGVSLVFVHVELTADMLQLTNAVLVLLAFGFITLLPSVYWSLLALTCFLYFRCLVGIDSPYQAHFAFLGGASVVLSILCFAQRYRTLSNVERLLLSNRSKSQALARRAREARQLLVEANEAAEQARRANEAKSVFLANASHELRTPLTGVLGMMRLLEKSALDVDQQELLDAAKFSAKTLLTLINDILDLARMEEGKLELKPGKFNPVDVGRQVVELLEPAAEGKGLKLSFDLEGAEEVPDVTGDSVRIGQILFNLVGNAVKFTDAGEVKLSLKMVKKAGDALLVRYQVRDTGTGMKPSDMARLFERFEQADSSAVKQQGGAGLGLAICRELAQLMEGTLHAESNEGAGSVFEFEVLLPIAKADTVESNDIAALGPYAWEERSLSVLVAEDNAVNQLLINKLFEKLPWQVTVVGNGAAAIEAVASGNFDLVLMDVRMPVMDGVEATRRIRTGEGKNSARIPIIALTANTMAEDVASYRAVGMDDVVAKPIQMSELKAAIDRVLGHAGQLGVT